MKTSYLNEFEIDFIVPAKAKLHFMYLIVLGKTRCFGILKRRQGMKTQGRNRLGVFFLSSEPVQVPCIVKILYNQGRTKKRNLKREKNKMLNREQRREYKR